MAVQLRLFSFFVAPVLLLCVAPMESLSAVKAVGVSVMIGFNMYVIRQDAQGLDLRVFDAETPA